MVGSLGSDTRGGGIEPTTVPGFRHQVAIAVITVACLMVLVASLLLEWQRRGRLVNIERPYQSRTTEFRIDINQADWPELTLLPNISETMARRVVAYRDSHGRFANVDELLGVRGIGPRTMAGLKPYLLPIATDDGAGEPAVTSGRPDDAGVAHRFLQAYE